MSDNPLSLGEQDIKLAVGRRVVELLDGEIFTVEGTPMMTRKTKEGKWENKVGIPGSEFTLSDCYVGKRKNLIFCFEPVDAQEFTVEIEARKMDGIFGGFSVSMKENIDELAEVETEDTERLIARLMNVEKANRKAEQTAREVEAKRELAEVYANNPNFGRFA